MGALLTSIHRNGFGHLTKVLDERRAPVRGQLERAGIEIPPGIAVESGQVMIVIAAPARTAKALDLLRTHGATATWTARRTSTPWPMFKTPLSVRARGVNPLGDSQDAG
jgi:hypothetical protein